MKIKGILIFLITIFLIGTISFVYADSSPEVGENQAKKIAQDYLDSHNLPYKVSTGTIVVDIKNKKTGAIKWVSPDKAANMTGFYEKEGPLPSNLASNFQWDYNPSPPEDHRSGEVWKVAVINSQGSNVGAIYIDSNSGEIFKKNLSTPKQNKNASNNTDSNNTTDSTKTSSEQNNQSGLPGTTGIILATVIIAIALGFSYWKFYGK